ncbi:YihY/virulence factor BrkB family protein [Metabacillus sp. GX 13764]|uniref:YihY/virulence factor BrkB family protein n=1 Tax=Metabacillus kandeliae TaxID=2900151 RepID=UPI001E4EC31F|nr:YihY/virulence factor BrkB family protein [Metabacillus kandeliae]MCD7032741.1 YihY/virulence factor BrkB family protein [Metabacillus kandeliae]
MKTIKELINRIQKHDLGDLAAVLAYYFLLSLFPLLIFLLTLLPYFQIDPNTVSKFVSQMAPGDSSELITKQINGLISKPNGGLLSFGILATIWSASNATNAVIRSLNVAHTIEESRPFWKVRLMAILLTFALVIGIVMTLVLPVFGDVILNTVQSLFPETAVTDGLFALIRFLISFVLIALILGVIYYFSPDVKLKVRDIYLGAIIGTILWQILSFAFSLYVSSFANYQATYGSLGGVIVLLTWLYLTGFVILIGGEINAIHYCWRTKKLCMEDEKEDLGIASSNNSTTADM